MITDVADVWRIPHIKKTRVIPIKAEVLKALNRMFQLYPFLSRGELNIPSVLHE